MGQVSAQKRHLRKIRQQIGVDCRADACAAARAQAAQAAAAHACLSQHSPPPPTSLPPKRPHKPTGKIMAMEMILDAVINDAKDESSSGEHSASGDDYESSGDESSSSEYIDPPLAASSQPGAANRRTMTISERKNYKMTKINCGADTGKVCQMRAAVATIQMP
eukprot:198016-Pelagomonas_calceolata.AAC.7